MKNMRFWLFLGGLVLLSVTLLFFNFRVAASNTQCDANITTVDIGEGLPYAMQRREKITIILVGEGPLARAVQKALMVEMHNARIGEVEMVQGAEQAYTNPVLVIKVGKPSLLWTPFYATSQVPIRARYSSIGDTDTTFTEDARTAIDDENGPALTMYAEYKVNDRSWGLISWPGYHQILADSVAHDVVASVKKLYEVTS